MMQAMAGDRPLYAFDLPGFGASFDPEPHDATLPNYAAWMLEATSAVGIARAHVFGHHTGTHLATEMVAADPGRFLTLMLNGVAYLTEAERLALAAEVRPAPAPDPDGKYLLEAFTRIKNLYPRFEPHLIHEETISSLRAHRTRALTLAAVWAQDFPAVLRKVRCPILATTASDDVWRTQFERVFVDRPDAERAVLGAAKFYTPEIDTALAVKVVRDFISRHPEGR